MRKLIAIIFIIAALSSISFSLNITKDYNAWELNDLIDTLDNNYNEVTVETLGTSYLNHRIKAIRIKNSETIYDDDMRYNKGIYHFLVLGGVHARERVNPKLLIKQIEYYLNNNKIPRNMVIHYIPLVNPDGYNLTLYNGINSEFLQSIEDKNYPRWKSNIQGVDINRNFPDIYLDLETFEWKDAWGHVDNKAYKSEEPSGQYYFGRHAGSEVETQILMDYMNRYKFEMALDYHSQGEVLFVDKWFMSYFFNKKSFDLAQTIMDTNGYTLPRDTGEYSSGFTMNYMANRHRIPSITIETTSTRRLPYLEDYEEIKAYEENKDVTVEVFKKAIALKKFGSYKTYDSSGYFFDDYANERIAKAYAQKYNLSIKNYNGQPIEHLDDFASEWAIQSIKELISIGILNINLTKGYQSDISVRDFLKSLNQINERRYMAYEQPSIVNTIANNNHMNRIQASYILYTYLDGDQYNIEPVHYKDIDMLLDKYKRAIYFVNKMGLIKGYLNDEFKPMDTLTKEEAAVILLRLIRLDYKGVVSDE